MLDSHPRRTAPRTRARRFIRCAALGLLLLVALPATASAVHNDDYFASQLINAPGSTLGSFSLNHDNVGATQENFFEDPGTNSDPFDFSCNAGGTIFYGSDVWYSFYPHRTGRYSVIVQATSGGYEPVVAVHPFNGGNLGAGGVCNGSTPPINRATLPASGFLPLTAGQGYRIQIGGANDPNQEDNDGTTSTPSEGGYNLAFTYDPNTDGDGLFDSQDRCDTQVGSTKFQGCPDTDADNIANPDDRCPTQRGPINFRGCPDTDGDRIPNPDDRCPRDSSSGRDPNRDGCLDLHALVDAKLNHTFYSGGIIVTSLEILKVPRGARVSVVCRRGRRKCGSFLDKRATAATPGARIAKTVRPRKFRNKRLRFGSTLAIRVTKRGATGKYIRYKVVHGTKRFKRVDRCINVGSKRLRKRRCK